MTKPENRAAASANSSVPLPSEFHAQLAVLTKAPPDGDEWLHELKFDGYRIGCRIDGRRIQLLSRNGKDWTQRFRLVHDAAAQLQVRRALLDGEVAMVLPDGRTSFQALQNAGDPLHGTTLVYFVFDVLHLDGEDLAQLPLEERKRRLQHLLPAPQGLIRYADHVLGNGKAFFHHACRQGLEGIVSKRRTMPYTPGRGPGWLKTKCIKRQELVIGGFTDPQGARDGVGALLVGVYDVHGHLVFAGKVGTGFTQRGAQELRRQLDRLAQAECPFTPCPRGAVGRTAHWVKPRLVAEVAFTEWTTDGKIRHPSFQGLRTDKSAHEVVREEPQAAADDAGTTLASRGAAGKSARRRRTP